MKSKLSLLAFFSSLLLLASFNYPDDNEISLFDKNGNAKAYIARLTIYLWEGDPVAYLSWDDSDDWHVYGFNGNHLGWYENGIIYDNEGYRVAVPKEAAEMITSIEPIKGIKGIKPVNSIERIAPMKPVLSDDWAKTPLVIFLRTGEK